MPGSTPAWEYGSPCAGRQCVLDREAMKAELEPKPASGMRERSSRATGRLRAAVIFAIVLALEWRFADPATIATDPVRSVIPWAMASLLPIFALGLWAYRITAEQHPAKPDGDLKVDVLHGVLAATVVYLAFFAYSRVAG